METDRKIADYMQKKNAYAKGIAMLAAAYLLVIAVFFYAYLFLQNAHDISIELGILRIIVRVVFAVLFITAGIIGACISIKFKLKSDDIPDEIAIRQSKNIIEFAYEHAKDALIFKMTVSYIMLTTGAIVLFLILSVYGFSEKGIYYSKIAFFIALAAFFVMYYPSFDRMRVYKKILNGTFTYKESVSCVKSVVFFVFLSLSVIIYLNWRYFGNNRTIAWIIFPVFLLLYLAVYAIYDYKSA